jgi:hypothetical protein
MDLFTDPNATFNDHLRESMTGTLNHLRTWFDNGHAPYGWTTDTLSLFWVWVGTHADEFRYTDDWQTLARRFADTTCSCCGRS